MLQDNIADSTHTLANLGMQASFLVYLSLCGMAMAFACFDVAFWQCPEATLLFQQQQLDRPLGCHTVDNAANRNNRRRGNEALFNVALTVFHSALMV